MGNEKKLLTFGPVPSRRLGRSLGINNIPPKICSYSCVYCQVGRTINMQDKRQEFYKPEEILKDVNKKVKEAEARAEPIDYLTFVSDGEPTLDIHLGEVIELLKEIGIRIAIITNASLISRKDVRDDLRGADWVSVKVDTVSNDIWRRLNRPRRSLKLDEILTGILEFSRTLQGDLSTETMIIKDINNMPGEIEKIADFIAKVNPKKSYISIPTRPPAEKWVQSVSEYALSVAYHIFSERHIDVECLIGYEGNAFAYTGNVEEDLLSITSVHPMRKDAVKEYLAKASADWEVVEKLIREEKLIEVAYKESKFYTRRFRASKEQLP